MAHERPTAHDTGTRTPRRTQLSLAAAAILLAAAVTGGMYWFGLAHTPDYATKLFGRSGADAVDPKATLATTAFVLALVQLALGIATYRQPRLPASSSTPGGSHRRIGLSCSCGATTLQPVPPPPCKP